MLYIACCMLHVACCMCMLHVACCFPAQRLEFNDALPFHVWGAFDHPTHTSATSAPIVPVTDSERTALVAAQCSAPYAAMQYQWAR